jgi:hypothetical protein
MAIDGNGFEFTAGPDGGATLWIYQNGRVAMEIGINHRGVLTAANSALKAAGVGRAVFADGLLTAEPR